jgi:hypothetical protein
MAVDEAQIHAGSKTNDGYGLLTVAGTPVTDRLA